MRGAGAASQRRLWHGPDHPRAGGSGARGDRLRGRPGVRRQQARRHAAQASRRVAHRRPRVARPAAAARRDRRRLPRLPGPGNPMSAWVDTLFARGRPYLGKAAWSTAEYVFYPLLMVAATPVLVASLGTEGF